MENEWVDTDVDDEDEADLGYCYGRLESHTYHDCVDEETAINAAIVASWDDTAYGVYENETGDLLYSVYGQTVFKAE
jgi:hypothetical protein